MLVEAYRATNIDFHWVDLVDPTVSELEYLAKTYELNPTSVRDCLTPKHLPKVELIEEYAFVILRGFDERFHNNGTIRGLTRKIAIFIGKNYLITVHRNDPSYMAQIRNVWVTKANNLNKDPLAQILIRIVQGVFGSYSQAIYHFERKVEEFEDKIFNEGSSRDSIQQKFMVKRKTSVIKQMLKMSLDLLPKLKRFCKTSAAAPLFQEMTEFSEGQYFTSVEILENINNLINLQLSLASHQTSEVIKVLTVFSMYFLPTTFVASLYGMNFKEMPELNWWFGYPSVLILMVLIILGLYIWFKRKNWV